MESPARGSAFHQPTTVSTSSPLPASVTRLWRPAAQRNIRNQWSKLAACRSQWDSVSSSARSHATSIVNAFLSQKYMPTMNLGVLKGMPHIRSKACLKLFRQQEQHQKELLLLYKEMVSIVTRMVSASKSMRCYANGSDSSPLVDFSCSSPNNDDDGDGGGKPIFAFWSISCFENLAGELVAMFACELSLKRLLVVEFLEAGRGAEEKSSCWAAQLYPGEFDHLKACGLFSVDALLPTPPRFIHAASISLASPIQFEKATRENLHVFLTTWLAEVNIDAHRVNDILGTVQEEIKSGR